MLNIYAGTVLGQTQNTEDDKIKCQFAVQGSPDPAKTHTETIWMCQAQQLVGSDAYCQPYVPFGQEESIYFDSTRQQSAYAHQQVF